MIIQNRDGSIAEEPRRKLLPDDNRLSYYAAVPKHLLDETSSLMDRIIGLAFDTLGVQHLEVRVYDAEENCS